MASMTLKQFEEFAKDLSEDIDKRKVARACGLELPIEPLEKQLEEVAVVNHTPKVTKNNPTPQERKYVSVPSLKLGQNSGTKGFWVNTVVARKIADRILTVCDEHDL